MTKINNFLNKLIDKLEIYFAPKDLDKIFKEEIYQYNKEVYKLFKELEISYKNNLNLYIYKPDVVMEKNYENIMPKLDMYKLKKEVEDIPLEEKYQLVENTIKLAYQNINNCIYVTFFDKETSTQPITITVWCLNPQEIRLGVFIQKENFEKSKLEQLEKEVSGILKIYLSKMFLNIEFVEKERETNSLKELIINMEDWRNFNTKKHLLNLTGLIIVLIFSQYINITKIK